MRVQLFSSNSSCVKKDLTRFIDGDSVGFFLERWKLRFRGFGRKIDRNRLCVLEKWSSDHKNNEECESKVKERGDVDF